MVKQAKAARAQIKAVAAGTINKVKAQQAKMAKALASHNAKDAARQHAALKFAAKSLKVAEKEASAKFGKAYMRLASDRGHFDKKLGAATTGLNDALAKQAALADSRFSKTVKDLATARKQATSQVQQLRKNFATQLATVTAEAKNVETRLTGEIGVVSGEVISQKANLIRVNRRVTAELKRIVKISDKRFSASKRARGKLKLLMDENKAAASAEVKALAVALKHKLTKIRARNARNRRAMAKDLSKATKALYERMSNMQKRNQKNASALAAATHAASVASANALKRAKRSFASKISMLTNTIAANAKRAEAGLQRITGVTHNIAKAAKADRVLIKNQINALEKDLNKAVVRAIAIGEARGKAVEQRLNEHLKKTKRYLQTELSEGIDRAADNVFKIVNGKRQKVADNYLSLKAYAVATADKVIDYRKKGKNGRNLSSIGDLLQTVAALGAVKAPKAQGLGMGGNKIPTLFTAKHLKVPGAVAEINGLVNEYTTSCAQVRLRWQLGLGKYLMDKLEESMLDKGILQVDKVQGKAGNFVYINGRSVGLSNKLNDFAKLAARMSIYESVLAKLTAKIVVPKHKAAPKPFFAKPPEWQGK